MNLALTVDFPICQTSALFRVLKYRELYEKYLTTSRMSSCHNPVGEAHAVLFACSL